MRCKGPGCRLAAGFVGEEQCTRPAFQPCQQRIELHRGGQFCGKRRAGALLGGFGDDGARPVLEH